MNNYIDERVKDLYKINIEQITFSIFEMVRRVEKGDIILETEFLRNSKWTNKKKSRLIESIVLNIPIQPIYLCEEVDFKYEVMDGQHRIKTIYEFINNKFPLKDSILFDSETYFWQMESSIKRKIEDYSLMMFILKYSSNPEVKGEVFERINTGARKVTDQEIRNYKYRNEGIQFIKYIVRDKCFQQMFRDVNINIREMQGQELALRFMSFYFKGIELYNGDLKKFLDNTLDEYYKYKYREDEVRYALKKALENVYSVFGEDSFILPSKNNRKNPKLNGALFDLLMISLEKYDFNMINENKNKIRNKLYELLETDKEFKQCIIGSSVNTKDKIRKRFEIWDNALKK